MATGANVNLSARHLELLKAVLKVMDANINFVKVAELADFKTAKYARDEWRKVKEKLIGEASTTKGDDATKASTGTKRKSAAAAGAFPAAKKAKSNACKGPIPCANSGGVDDEEAAMEVKAAPSDNFGLDALDDAFN